LRKNKAGGISLPDFKIFYKASVIKTVWYRRKDIYTDKWNRTQSPQINPHIHWQQIFHKEAKNTQWERDSLFNKWWWETGHPHAKE